MSRTSLGSDLEFFTCISESHETEDTEDHDQSISTEFGKACDVHSLGIISQPVAEINSLDVVPVELGTTSCGSDNRFSKSQKPAAAATMGMGFDELG